LELVVGLIGAGIGPSLSPALHEREGRELGLHYRYRRLDLDVLGVAPDRIGELLTKLRAEGYRGVNVTHPAKRLVLDHLDEIAPDAARIGAVNTVVFTDGGAVGHNTDRTGFTRGLSTGLGADEPPGARLDRVVLLGAGGAGAAAAHALLDLGTTELAVVDTDIDAATRLAEATGGTAGTPDDLPRLLARADGLVHATPSGMAEHPGLPLPEELLDPRLWVADIVYRPLHTELLRAARRRGCRTVDGGAMAVHQAVDSFALFTGRTPDAGRMTRHFVELVEAEEDARAR
jgi:shikimate dehydrogenase